MLTKEQIIEIRNHLENSKNPLFFFDNDPDGLCSFLILRRYLGRGNWAVVKSSASVTKGYFKKVEEFNPDYIFVLDKPKIDQDFLELAKQKSIPIIQIDHHVVDEPHAENYYNPQLITKTNEPVSELCYRITNRKEDLWLACTGSISDCYLPDFIKDFEKNNSDLLDFNYKTAFDVLYNTKLGKVSMLMSFGLRDTTSNVHSMIRFLLNAKNAYDLFEENSKTKSFLSKFDKINKKYKLLLEKAEKFKRDRIIFFSYSSEIGLNRDLSNELMYKYPNKVIFIAFISGNRCNISLRWEKGDIRTPTMKAIEGLENASAGGHEHAPGAVISTDQLSQFKENLYKELGIKD